MSCAACSARVEKTVSSVDGVSACSVNLLTGTMLVEGATDEKIIDAVRGIGYGAMLIDGSEPKNSKNGGEIRRVVIRLLLSLLFLLPLMYITMGHLMLSLPMPFSDSAVFIGVSEAVLSAIVVGLNYKFFKNGFLGAVRGAPNMDTLVALGSGVSYGWSVFVLVKVFFAESESAHKLLHGLYFESAAMILTLITVGKLLEAIAKGKSTDAIGSLLKLTPKTAILLKDGVEVEILSEKVTRGDLFVVKPGASVPVDGVVVEGGSEVDESVLTGESMPTEKVVGSKVYAATVNTVGYMVCRAENVGDDTVMSGIVKMVSDASASKAPIAKVADRVAGIFVPVVLAIAFLTSIIWFFVNNDLPHALERGICVLVISCPCAMGLATPVAIMVGMGICARHGVLFRNAESLEILGRVRNIALDKTGTITKGEPEVVDVIPLGVGDSDLISVAYSVERGSEHPLAKAIVRYAELKNAKAFDVTDFEAMSGRGVSAKLGGDKIFGVNYSTASEMGVLNDLVSEKYRSLSEDGKTAMIFIRENEPIGIIAVRDVIKEDAKDTLSDLGALGLRTVMLTGDNSVVANKIANEIGGCEVVSDVLPDGKEEVIRSLSESGVTAMVGDGINDAPSLTRADVGIAIGSGTDIAIESADVVLMHDTTRELSGAVRLSRATLSVIKQNLFWAFCYNIVGIPLAAGAFSVLLGWELTPAFGALAMSVSSLIVVLNALRLNLKRTFLKNGEINCKTAEKCEKSNNYTIKEQEKMEKVFKVEGMMCPHCEAHAKRAVEAIEGVESAVASHTAKTVTVTMTADVSDEAIKAAIKDAGYEVVG